MIDFNQIKRSVNQSTLTGLQGIDPYKILGDLGISTENISNILKGDYSSLLKSEPFIVDYEVFHTNYGFDIDFQKIKNGEEVELPDEFFEKLFIVAQDGIFQIEDEDCLLISYNKDIFIITKDTKIIHYALNASKSL